MNIRLSHVEQYLLCVSILLASAIGHKLQHWHKVELPFNSDYTLFSLTVRRSMWRKWLALLAAVKIVWLLSVRWPLISRYWFVECVRRSVQYVCFCFRFFRLRSKSHHIYCHGKNNVLVQSTKTYIWIEKENVWSSRLLLSCCYTKIIMRWNRQAMRY